MENEAPSCSLAFLQACAGIVGVLSVSHFGEVVFGVQKNDWSCGDHPGPVGGGTEGVGRDPPAVADSDYGDFTLLTHPGPSFLDTESDK